MHTGGRRGGGSGCGERGTECVKMDCSQFLWRKAWSLRHGLFPIDGPKEIRAVQRECVTPLLLDEPRPDGISRPEELEDIRVADEVAQSGIPLFARAQTAHIP